jgi:hypothetical protein
MSPTLSRRDFIAASGAVVAMTFPVRADDKVPPPTLHNYTDYGWLRGFNIVPSWGARVEEAWWSYHADRMREEVSLPPQVHANCLRLWIEVTAWWGNPEKVTAHFMDAVAAIDEAGMKVMPCLFNRWHDRKADYGGTYVENLRGDWQLHLDYVRALVKPLADDKRILLWDLCNEPQAQDRQGDVNQREYAWLEKIAATVRECGARQPITIGTMSGNNVLNFAPLVDVICAHPYVHTPAELEKSIAFLKSASERLQKPALVNETIPGALDDQERAEVARYYTEQLSAAGFGWMGWAVREGKAISTRRDLYDGNGLRGQGFHPYFTKAGKLRGGLEFLTETPQHQPPWKV